MESSNPRYQGKPLLLLLESYVLWAIDELSETRADTLEKMTPKLRSVYGVEGNWQEVIAAAVELPPTLPAMIRELWLRNREIARENNVTLTAQKFAEMFVDQNLMD